MLHITHKEKLAIQMIEYVISIELDSGRTPSDALGNAKLSFIKTMAEARNEVVSIVIAAPTRPPKESDLQWGDIMTEVHADRFLACVTTVVCPTTNKPLYRRYHRLTDARYTDPIKARDGWESGDPAFPDYRKTDVFMYTGVRLKMLEERQNGRPAEMGCICEVELDENGKEKRRWWRDEEQVLQSVKEVRTLKRRKKRREGRIMDWVWRGDMDAFKK